MEEIGSTSAIAFAGLIGGIVLGFAARWGRFCTLGAIEDWVLGSDTTRLRIWLFALGVAILGTHLSGLLGLVPLLDSAYLTSPTPLLSTLAGSLLFGLGMSLAGTCGFGLLARLGGGDLKSLLGFFSMGIFAYSTMRGLLAYPRQWLFGGRSEVETPHSMALWLENVFGGNFLVWGCAIGSTLLIVALRSQKFRQRPRAVIAGSLVGLAIVGGWLSTSLLSSDFDPYPLESHTFSAPLGETIIYVMAATGTGLRFGIGAVFGVVIGAVIGSRQLDQFRWEACDDVREIRRQLVGGLLMGFGGVLAFGCTVGQGLSAASVLAFSAPVALFGVFVGAWIGLQWLVNGELLETISERWRGLCDRCANS